MSDFLTTRQVADEINNSPFVSGATVREWQVRRLFEDGNLAERPKFGGKRLLGRSDIPAIVDALRTRGWLSSKEVASP